MARYPVQKTLEQTACQQPGYYANRQPNENEPGTLSYH